MALPISKFPPVDLNGGALGVAGTSTGALSMSGATSGTVVFTVAAVAGSYTFTLPATAGSSGEQLATNGSGVTSWASAGSIREVKNVIAEVSDKAKETLDRLLKTRVYEFRYKPEAERHTTLDHDTVYTGVMAEELPEVMHHGGKIFSPVSAFGELLLALKGLAEKVDRIEARQAAGAC